MLRDQFGADHPDTRCADADLASDLAALGEDHAARDRSQALPARATRVRGADRPDNPAGTVNLVADLRAAGDAEQARGRWVEPKHPHVQPGAAHPCTLQATGRLALDGALIGDAAATTTQGCRVHQQLQARAGGTRPLTAMTGASLARLAGAAGNRAAPPADLGQTLGGQDPVVVLAARRRSPAPTIEPPPR